MSTKTNHGLPWLRHALPRLVPLACMVSCLGCNAPKYAPVSGVVTLNGKPLAEAVVSFRLITDDEALRAAPGSSGKTNDKGEYSLRAEAGSATAERDGAIVGKHKVIIALVNTADGDERTKTVQRNYFQQLPERYSTDASELTCVVPAEGRKDANFELKSP